MNKIIVSRLWHKKGKSEYYTMFQLKKYFPDIDFEFHIILDQPEYNDNWSKKIDELGYTCFWYTKEDMKSYLIDSGYGTEELISKIPNFVHFYHILINHYLRRKFLYDYTLSIEYDVLFNDTDLKQIRDCLLNKIPFSIVEPSNVGCDKALANTMSNLFQQNIVKYQNLGFNAGFQGLNLGIYDEFLNISTFNLLIQCFDFTGIYNADGSEKTGWERTIIDTQEQSFQCLLNALSSNHQILDPNEYYVFPYWVDMNHLMKSKVIHFIGHEKPKEMFDIIDKNLEI